MKTINKLVLTSMLLTMVGCGAPNKAPSTSQGSSSTGGNGGAGLATNAQEDSALIAEIGACDATKLSEVCYSNNNQAYYYCTVSGNWSETQIFPTTTTMTVAPDKGQNCIGSAATMTASTTASVQPSEDNTWVSPTTGLTWEFGNTITPAQLQANNTGVFTTNFLCPDGSSVPTQAQYEAEFSSSFLNWIGNQFLIVGLVNATYKQSYYIVVADAEGKFDLINAQQISTSTTAICIVTK